MSQYNQTDDRTIARNIIITLCILLCVSIFGIIWFFMNRTSDTERYADLKTDIKSYYVGELTRAVQKAQINSTERIEFTVNEEYQPIIDAYTQAQEIDCEKVKGSESECYELKNNLSILNDSFQIYIDIYNSYSIDDLVEENFSDEDNAKLEGLISDSPKIASAVSQIKKIVN